MNTEFTVENRDEAIATTQKIIENYNMQGRLVILTTPQAITIYDNEKGNGHLFSIIIFVVLPLLLLGFIYATICFEGNKISISLIAVSLSLLSFCWCVGLWSILSATQLILNVDLGNRTLEIARVKAVWERYNSKTLIAFNQIVRIGLVEELGEESRQLSGYAVTIWPKGEKEIALMSFGLDEIETIFRDTIMRILETTFYDGKTGADSTGGTIPKVH